MQTNMIAHLYRFKVRCPIPQTGTYVWTVQTAWGVDDDDAAREIIERIPTAIEMWGLPAPENDTEPARVICGKRLTDLTPSDTKAWCVACGQDWEHHPVTTHSSQARDAMEWIATLDQEGVANFI